MGVPTTQAPPGPADDADRVRTCETHIGVVLLVGDRAYKFKKPVDVGFADFTRRAERERICHREVELNRRLAPDVYLGVATVLGPGGAPCEHLVVMRRMPEDRRLSSLIADGVPVTPALRQIARLVATFHARADRGPAITGEGSRDALLRRWEANFAETQPFYHSVLGEENGRELQRLVREFLAGRKDLFARRMDTGRIVDGHGDLLADDIFCLDDGPRVLDCLEFDDRLRWVDGMDDVAFLAMDLERLGAPDLATTVLDLYADFAGDPAPPTLRHHYIAYRAFVRAKVACLRWAQGERTSAGLAQEYTTIALRHLRAGAVRLILVGGPPASGKSTLAGLLADQLGATVLRSDRIRKELAGICPEHNAATDFERGIYHPAHTRRTYAELNRRAACLLALGETVILDASWTSPDERASAAETARQAHARVVPLCCSAPAAVTATRLATRGPSISDATPEVAAQLWPDTHDWPDAHTVLTAGTKQESLEQALGYLS